MKSRKVLKVLLLILSVSILIRLFIGEPCTIPSESMYPAILAGDRMWIDYTVYGARLPRRFADIPIVNVFTWIKPLREADQRMDWGYKRLKGKRQPKAGDIAVFESPEFPHPLVVKRIDSVKQENGMNYYYMLGDNRKNSHDSREFGYIPDSLIVGRINVVLYSLHRDRIFPLNIRWNSFLKKIK